MHLQPVTANMPKTICPQCEVLQNIEVISHDEETDVLSGQRCWYCGGELRQLQLQTTSQFKIVVAGDEVPVSPTGIGIWEEQFIHDYGAEPINFRFDDAGRCVITLQMVQPTADDSGCTGRCSGRCAARGVEPKHAPCRAAAERRATPAHVIPI